MDYELGDTIAKECLNLYQNLGKKGKPIPDKEWTLLSSIVVELDGKFTVVAMATGTKCIGRNEMTPRGDLVNDSHAEVLARRGFLRYMYDQISKFNHTGSSDIIVSCNEGKRYEINPKVKFHFYSSHIPCGDASIIPKHADQYDKRKHATVNQETTKRQKLDMSCLEVKLKNDGVRGSTNQIEDTDEEIRNVCKSPNEICSASLKVCKQNSCSEADLGIFSQETKLSDEYFRLNKVRKCSNCQLTLPLTDRDLRNLPDTAGNHKDDSVFIVENQHSLSKLIEESPTTQIKDEDDRNCNELTNGNFKRVGNEDSIPQFFYNNDEDLNKNMYKETSDKLQDCVGELVDVHRTGAKCVAGKDSRLPGALYHVVAAVRTKPGRGDPTLSVSCSDKMARWIACGLQGALLSLLLSQPVLLDSVVIGSGGPYSQDVLHRAIIRRTGTRHCSSLLQSSSVFPHSRYRACPPARPCPSAIVWAHVSHKALEICVEGRRQGVTKKCRDDGRLMVCKLELLRAFLLVAGDKYHGMAYREIKKSADQYYSVWAQAKSTLGAWTTKPQHLEDFKLMPEL